MTNQELVKIAEDIHAGRIFTDRHIPSGDRQGMVPLIFLPIALADAKMEKRIRKDKPALVYEYLDKAGPRGINGYPIFMSCRFLTKEDSDKVWKAYEEIEEAMKVVREGVASDLGKK